MARDRIDVRLSPAELTVFDRLPGETRADRLRYLLHTRTIADALGEKIEKVGTAMEARISMLQDEVSELKREIDSRGRWMQINELRRILTTFASAFAFILPTDQRETMRGIAKKIKTGAYADDAENEQNRDGGTQS